MECTFEQFIEEVKEYLRKIDQLSEAVEEQLRTYGGVQRHLKAICEAPYDGGRTYALNTKKICEEILHSDYIETKSKAAALSSTVKNVGPYKVKVPARLLPRVEEVEGYDAKIQKELNKADTLLQKIERKLSQIVEEGTCNLSIEAQNSQIKMLNIDFTTCLAKASDDLRRAYQAFASFRADAKRYLLEKGAIAIAVAAVVAAGGAAVGFAVGAAVHAAGQFSHAASVGAGAGGFAMVVPKVYNLLNDYDKLMEHCRKLESKLNLLQSDCDNKKKD